MARRVSCAADDGDGATLAARILALVAASMLSCSSPAAAQAPSFACGPCWCDSWASLAATARCSGPLVGDIPAELPHNVSSLTLTSTALTTLRADRLSRLEDLVVFFIDYDSSLTRIERGAFSGLLTLTDLIINHCKNLQTIDEGVLSVFGQLRNLDLRYNGLLDVPDFSAFVNIGSTLSVRVNLDHNSIKRLANRSWCKDTRGCQPSVEFGPVYIRNNALEEIEEMAFAGSAITSLDLSNNVQLQTLHSSSFQDISLLSTLRLANTSISSFPSSGLERLRELHLENTPFLKTLPATVQYQELRRAYVHYPHLCCAFQYPKVQNEIMYDKIKKLQEERCSAAAQWSGKNVSPTRSSATSTGRRTGLAAELRSRRAAATAARNGSASPKIDNGGAATWGVFNPLNRRQPTRLSTLAAPAAAQPRLHYGSGNGQWMSNSGSLYDPAELPHDPCSSDDWNLHLWREQNFQCSPAPNAFNPCIDVLETDWLRCVMWVTALLTVLGNAAVLFLTVFVKAPITVTKLLVCHLMIADLILGTFLISLVAEDGRTKGNYFNYALEWQYGGSCDAVGLLAVLGAELSVFTLVVITVERWYTIRNAMQLTKRITKRHAAYILCGGWLLCGAVAAAPALGASSYRITSLCLPFRYESLADKVYVVILMVANIGACVVVLACYVSMYVQVRGSSCMVNKSDTEMAKRMACLVGVNFLCWGPVAIVAGLSAGGVDINVPYLSGSSLTHAKVVLAIFFPISALANPLLYALLTRQFQNDVVATFSRWGICQKNFMSYAMDTFGHSSSSGGAGRGISRSRSAAGDRLPLSAAHSAVGAPLLADCTEAADKHVRRNSVEHAELLRRSSGTSDRSSCCDDRPADGSSAAHPLRNHEYGMSQGPASTQRKEEIELTDAASACCSYRQQKESAAEVDGQRRHMGEHAIWCDQDIRMMTAGDPADGVRSSANGLSDCKLERLCLTGSPTCNARNDEVAPAAAATFEAVGIAMCATPDSRSQLADDTTSASDIDRQEADEGAVCGAASPVTRMCDDNDGTGELERQPLVATSAVAANAAVDGDAELEPLLGEPVVHLSNVRAVCRQLSRDLPSRPSKSCSTYNEDTIVVTFAGSSFLVADSAA